MATRDGIWGPLKALIERFGEHDFSEEELQRLVEHADILIAIGNGTLTREQLPNRPINPYTKTIKEPSWDYPPGFTDMWHWHDQFAVLQTAYHQLSSDGLREMAEQWIARKEIWEETSVHAKTGKVIRNWNGMAVFPLPGKVAAKYGLGDLWADVALGTKGKGLWGKLLNEVLFPRLQQRIRRFANLSMHQMVSDHFLPDETIPTWFQNLESRVAGDFACCPLNFGRRLAGYSLQAAVWEIKNVISGIPACSWVVGNALFSQPERLAKGSLWIRCPGDRTRFKSSPKFEGCPWFINNDCKVYFDVWGGNEARSDSGFTFLAR